MEKIAWHCMEEDINVMHRNIYETCDLSKVIFLMRKEKPNSLSFSLQTFVQQWGESYIMNQQKYET